MGPLQYLDFDFSDEASGRGSFDAMASVAPSRVAALLSEIAGVLRWAHRTFGPPGALQDDSEWDYALHAVAEPDHPLRATYDDRHVQVTLEQAPPGTALTTVTLTLSGSPAFCDAFRTEFSDSDSR